MIPPHGSLMIPSSSGGFDSGTHRAPMAEGKRACPPSHHPHSVELEKVSSIPLAACWSCPGCICVIKIVLVWCRLMDLCLLRKKSSNCEMEQVR